MDWSDLPIGQVSGGALFLLCCWWITRRIVRGDLVPRQHLLDVKEDAELLRTGHETQQAVSLQQGVTLEKLTAAMERSLATQEVILHVVKEIQRGAQGGGGP